MHKGEVKESSSEEEDNSAESEEETEVFFKTTEDPASPDQETPSSVENAESLPAKDAPMIRPL